MKILNKLVKILSLDFSAKIILAFISLSLIRLFSTEELALYTIIFTTVNLISSLIASIINKLFIIGNFEEKGYSLSNFLSLQLMMLVLFYFILLGFSHLFGGYLFSVYFLILLKVFLIFIQTYYQKSMDFRKYYKVEYFRIILYLAFFFLIFLTNNLGLREIIHINIISLTLVCLIYGSQLISINEMFDLKKSIKMFSETLYSEYRYLYLFSIATLILVNLDVYMLRAIDTTYQVAIFGAAFTFYSFLKLGLDAVQKLFLPLVNSIKKVSEIKRLFNQHIKLSLSLIPFLIIGLFLSEKIIPIIDGGKYPESIIIFQILAISAFFSFVFSPFSNILLKYKEFKYQFKLIVFGILVHVTLNLLVINKYHALGLACVNLLVYLGVNFLMFVKGKTLLND